MIDILLATYNGEKYLKQQLDSLLEQTYSEFRILIRDDGSKDKTLNIINDYKIRYPSKILIIKDDKKCGSSVSNFMELSKYSNSEYVMFCDQDDYWLKNKIEVSLQKIKEVEQEYGKNTPILVFGKYKAVDENLKPLNLLEKNSQVAKPNVNLSNLMVQNCVTGCLVILNKKLNDLMGDYNHSIQMHDWWAALIASAMGKIVFVDDILMLYRQHSNNVVGFVDVTSTKYIINKILDKNTRYAKETYKNQMEYFVRRFSTKLPSDSFNKINYFLQIYKEPSKLKRIKMLIKGGYLKSNLIRIIGQLFYI